MRPERSAPSKRKPTKCLRFESSEKARPVYEKALRLFHHLRAFSELELVTGLEPATAGCS